MKVVCSMAATSMSMVPLATTREGESRQELVTTLAVGRLELLVMTELAGEGWARLGEGAEASPVVVVALAVCL